MNKIILMGRLTKDVEIRTSKKDSFVANYTLAVNRRFTNPGEERQADFINIVAFGKTAEFCNKHFKKGQQVGVIGRIQVRNWDDNGQKRYATEVVAEEVYFADSSKDKQGTTTTNETAPTETTEDTESISSDDDLPF